MTPSYDDMLHLPHHVSPCRPPMSREMRAAQFAPFAALSGYRELIREQSRLTEPGRELSPEVQEELKRKLDLLAAGTSEHPRIRVTWFCPDGSPEGRIE